MSQTISLGTGKPYGVQRVCHVWEQARSSFYYATRQVPQAAPKCRGPRPSISDEDLLALIRHDLATSQFTGEGHRKVWARLRVRDGVRVSRRRVLRLMRENHLLSPYRGRLKAAKTQTGPGTGPDFLRWNNNLPTIIFRGLPRCGCRTATGILLIFA